ncbi:hypothetical protein [Agaribacterium haliotis]|nr:hypothetical protein [Agaribacterium haliotis]
MDSDSSAAKKISDEQHADSVVDAIAATALIVIFVSACIFWISGQ